MKTPKRHVFWFFLTLATLVFLSVFLARLQGEINRRKLDCTLIAAIKGDKPDEAIRLLANGANANARDIPPDTRTFWQKVREIWRPVRRDETVYPSALTLALRHDLTTANPNAPETSFQLIKALHDLGAKEDGRFAVWGADLQEAEQQIKENPDMPTGPSWPPGGVYEADQELTDFLNAKGMAARAVAALAECRFREDKYADAIHYYRIAALWHSTDLGLQSRLARSEEYAQVAETIQPTLPAGRSVFSVRPYPVYGLPGALVTQRGASSGAWIALCGVKEDNEISEAQAALYQWNGVGFQEDCHTPVLRHQWNEDDNFREINLCVLPLTGRAAPEILLCGWMFGGADAPSEIQAFACEGRRFTRIAAVADHARVEAEKTPQGTRYVITNFYTTGLMKTEYDRAWRSDYYAFNGKRFVFADAQYPKDCRDYIEEAEKALHDCPDDYDLRQNLASMYSITGRPQKAAQYYRKAERLCRRAIAKESQDESWNDRKILEQIVARDPERHF